MLKFLSNNPFFNAVRNIKAVLDPDQKRRSLMMIGLMIVNAFFDVLGLATIFVLIRSALEGGIITASEYVRGEEVGSAEHYFNLALRSIYHQSGAKTEIELLFYLSIFIFFVFIIKNGVSLWITYIQTRFAYNISLRLNKKMFKYYYDQGYLFINDVATGKKVYSIVDIPMRFAGGYLMTTFFFSTELLVILILSIALICYNPLAVALLLIVIVPVFLAIYIYSKNRVVKIGNERNITMPLNYGKVIEAMKAFVDVKLGNLENSILEQYEKSQKNLNRTDVLNNGIYQRIHQKTNDIIFGLGITVIFSYAYFADVEKDSVLTLLGFFGIAAYKVLPAINRMMNSILTIKNSSFVIDELKIITRSPLKKFKNVKRMDFHKTIELRNISFQYPNSDQNVLTKINLSIKKGESIGIVGGSGSGKTTLLKLLLRLMPQTNGDFIIDDKNILNSTELDAGFQLNIGYVEQNVFILNGTLAQNIAFGERIVDTQLLEKSIAESMLKDFIDEHPDGINMELGEEGVKLSGGQKQRVGIARALYKQSEILVFDEVTSALDPITEKSIVESINHISDLGKTVIIVAHRVTTLEKCDRIIQLANGEIEKELNYKELMSSMNTDVIKIK